MRKYILSLLLLLASVTAFAVGDDGGYTVEAVPNVHLQDRRQYVSDPSRLLSDAARDSINAMMARLEATTGIETAVVMLPSIGDADLVDFSVSLFRRWGIGKKKSDNGLLILYVEDIHRIRFATGYGIEGLLTDAMSKRIQMREMVPRFKNGDRDGGMVAGCKAVVSVLDGSMQPEADDDDGLGWSGVIAMLIIITVMGILLIHRRKLRCPECGQKSLSLTSTDHFVQNAIRYRKEIYTCSKCGRVVVKNIPDDDNHHDDSSFLTGFIMGSILNGRGGGDSGFSGGSFGGGSTGGGGSSSGW